MKIDHFCVQTNNSRLLANNEFGTADERPKTVANIVTVTYEMTLHGNVSLSRAPQ